MSYDQRSVLLTRPENDLDLFLERVKPVIEDVRIKGDAALVKYAAKFDKAHFRASDIKASETEFEEAFDLLDRDVIEALEYGANNIRRFHEDQLPDKMQMKPTLDGVLSCCSTNTAERQRRWSWVE